MEEKGAELEEKSEENEQEIIKSLEQAIRDNLETLKSDIRSSLNKTKQIGKSSGNKKEIEELKKSGAQYESFINYFGSFPTISPRVLNKFNINISNFKNSIEPFLNEVDLESLYYYISIYQIIGESINLDREKIITILKQHIANEIFVSIKIQAPDPKSIFYGLSILSELNYEKSSDILDFEKVKDFLSLELDHFIPKKLHLNYFTLHSTNVLNNFGYNIKLNRKSFIENLYNLDIINLEEFDPIIDFYELFTSCLLLNKDIILSKFKKKYKRMINNTLNQLKLENMTITSCARTLLIIDILNIKDEKNHLIFNLLDKIMKSTHMFNSEVNNTDFYWKNDKIAWIIELKIVFWALLSSFQYYSFIE